MLNEVSGQPLSHGVPWSMETRLKRCARMSGLALVLCLTLAPTVSTQEAMPSDPLYVIQPNDLLRIFVFNEAELSGQVLVRPDGRISLPLVQDLQAAGLNPGELKERVEERLLEYISVPNVTVIVDAIQSYRVYVTGQVREPGAITAQEPLSVLQAISLAGGFLDFANLEEIVIIRATGENSRLFRFNYSEVIRGMNYNQNMLLRSGDVVAVP